MVKFYDTMVSNSPFYMRELATKLSGSSNKRVIDKYYKRIYMQIRFYKKEDWQCKEVNKGRSGRSPLLCTYVGDAQ